MVVFALLVAAAAHARRSRRNSDPALISIWMMGAMVIVFVLMSGVGISVLGRSTSREFPVATRNARHELGRLYAIAYALLLFTWAESKNARIKLMMVASMGVVVVALVFTFSRGAFLDSSWSICCSCSGAAMRITMIFVGLLRGCAVWCCRAQSTIASRTGTGRGLDAISAGRIVFYLAAAVSGAAAQPGLRQRPRLDSSGPMPCARDLTYPY